MISDLLLQCRTTMERGTRGAFILLYLWKLLQYSRCHILNNSMKSSKEHAFELKEEKKANHLNKKMKIWILFRSFPCDVLFLFTRKRKSKRNLMPKSLFFSPFLLWFAICTVPNGTLCVALRDIRHQQTSISM